MTQLQILYEFPTIFAKLENFVCIDFDSIIMSDESKTLRFKVRFRTCNRVAALSTNCTLLLCLHYHHYNVHLYSIGACRLLEPPTDPSSLDSAFNLKLKPFLSSYSVLGPWHISQGMASETCPHGLVPVTLCQLCTIPISLNLLNCHARETLVLTKWKCFIIRRGESF